MRKVVVDELLTLSAYESVRDAWRRRVIAHKKPRRVFLGEEISLVFEDHDTVQLQVQEVLRAEKITALDAIEHELDGYNDLIAPDGSLLATLMIETQDPDARELRRAALVGLDDAVFLLLGETRVKAEFDALGRGDDKTSVVRYVTFAMPADARARLLDASTAVTLRCEHPNYAAETAFTAETRQSLARDL